MYSSIPKCKIHDCDFCDAKDTEVRKIGKQYYCLSKCYRELKTNEQLVKLKKKTVSSSLKSKIRTLHSSEENREMVKGSAELNRWFTERRKEMTGKCANCGGKSEKDSDRYFKFSIAHLLPKAYVKSVATHPDNWIELCFFNNSCHTNFDNGQIDIIDLHCFDQVIQKFARMYPSIAKDEQRRIPAILLEYIKTEI